MINARSLKSDPVPEIEQEVFSIPLLFHAEEFPVRFELNGVHFEVVSNQGHISGKQGLCNDRNNLQGD